MKNNLGKIFLFLMFIVLDLSAKEYRWSASIDKKQAYVNEAVHLHYSCEFNSRDELHVIEFNPVGEYKDYDIHLLSERESIVDGKRVNDFEFVAFVKRSGLIEFDFDVLMKKTNQDSIDNTVLGRDNAVYEQFSKKLIKQKVLSVDVLENNLNLLGEFDFEIKKDKTSINAYEPYHFEIIIKGVGNLDKLSSLDLNISDAKVFSSRPKKDYVLSKGGYKGTWSQKFAIVADDDFKFPSIEYKYFDIVTKKPKTYSSKAFRVDVKKLYKKEELLDKEENDNVYFKREYIYYLLAFIFGFLLAKVKIKKHKSKSEESEFLAKVDKCKSLDEILVLLVVNDPEKYSEIIEKIEKKHIGLSQIKKILK